MLQPEGQNRGEPLSPICFLSGRVAVTQATFYWQQNSELLWWLFFSERGFTLVRVILVNLRLSVWNISCGGFVSLCNCKHRDSFNPYRRVYRTFLCLFYFRGPPRAEIADWWINSRHSKVAEVRISHNSTLNICYSLQIYSIYTWISLCRSHVLKCIWDLVCWEVQWCKVLSWKFLFNFYLGFRTCLGTFAAVAENMPDCSCKFEREKTRSTRHSKSEIWLQHETWLKSVR